MENMSVLQIGAKYSYRELVDDIDLSYKYRCIIKQLLLQEVDADTTIESHLYYMKPQDESCRIYRQLRAKIRIYVRGGTGKLPDLQLCPDEHPLRRLLQGRRCGQRI